MAFIPFIPNGLIVLVVFGIPFALVGIIALIIGTSIISWIKESTTRVHQHFFCSTRKMDVDVDFRPEVFSSDYRDVESCSAFGDGPVTCEKDCLHSDH